MTAAALRQARLRDRRRHGRRVLAVDIEEDAFTAALLAARRLSADEIDDPAALAREAAAVISDWCNIWLAEGSTGATARRW